MKIKLKEMDIELTLEAKVVPPEVAKEVINLFYTSLLPKLDGTYTQSQQLPDQVEKKQESIRKGKSQ